jgi:glycine cleavage system H protein
MNLTENRMNVPTELKYTATHEWIRADADGTLTIGITDHAQQSLGDLVFIELPKPGRKVAAGEACAVVESVKAASDIYAPVAGTIVAANGQVVESPEIVNADAYGQWLYKLKPETPGDSAALLDAAAYITSVGDA